MTKKAAHPRAEHALFPVPVDAQDVDLSERDIYWIYVSRGGETATKRWKFDELQDEEQIFQEYGGGTFVLKARNEAKSRWTASRELRFGGHPKPLNEVGQPVAPAPAQAPSPMAEISSPAIRDGLAIAAVVGPLVLQYADASARRSEAQMNLLLTILGKQNAGPNDQLMNVLLQSAIQRNPGQEHFAMMQNALQMGMQMGAASKGGDEDSSDMLEAFTQGVNGFVELEKIKAQRQQNQGQGKPPGAT